MNQFLLDAGLSLLVAVLATALAAALAVACGALDAWSRLSGPSGRAPRGTAVYVPPLLALPALALLDGGVVPLVAGLIAWLNLAYVVRQSVAALHARAFIDAARMAGLTPGRIVARHVLPHLTRPVGLRALLTVPQVFAGDALRQLLEAAAR